MKLKHHRNIQKQNAEYYFLELARLLGILHEHAKNYKALALDDRWITTENGSRVLLGDDGEIKAGMGGKFNGQKIGELGKHNPSSSKQAANPVPKVETKGLKGISKEHANFNNAISDVNSSTGLDFEMELSPDAYEKASPTEKNSHGGAIKTYQVRGGHAEVRVSPRGSYLGNKRQGIVTTTTYQRVGFNRGEHEYSRGSYSQSFSNQSQLEQILRQTNDRLSRE